jgi:hypothetical protein
LTFRGCAGVNAAQHFPTSAEVIFHTQFRRALSIPKLRDARRRFSKHPKSSAGEREQGALPGDTSNIGMGIRVQSTAAVDRSSIRLVGPSYPVRLPYSGAGRLADLLGGRLIQEVVAVRQRWKHFIRRPTS